MRTKNILLISLQSETRNIGHECSRSCVEFVVHKKKANKMNHLHMSVFNTNNIHVKQLILD